MGSLRIGNTGRVLPGAAEHRRNFGKDAGGPKTEGLTRQDAAQVRRITGEFNKMIIEGINKVIVEECRMPFSTYTKNPSSKTFGQIGNALLTSIDAKVSRLAESKGAYGSSEGTSYMDYKVGNSTVRIEVASQVKVEQRGVKYIQENTSALVKHIAKVVKRAETLKLSEFMREKTALHCDLATDLLMWIGHGLNVDGIEHINGGRISFTYDGKFLEHKSAYSVGGAYTLIAVSSKVNVRVVA